MAGLCFEGGGVKGIAYVGVIKYIQESGRMNSFKVFSGSSIGAFISFLCVLGMTWKEMESILMVEDLRDTFLDNKWGNGISFLEYMRASWSLFWNWGLYSGQKLQSLLKGLLLNRGYKEDVTFAELQRLTGKELMVSATNNNKRRGEFFNSKLTPNESVVRAVHMSMSFPFVFVPTFHNGDYYSDGGIASNFPFKDTKIQFPDVKLIGCKLLTKGEEVTSNDQLIFKNRDRINSVIDYLMSVVNTTFQTKEEDEMPSSLEKEQVIISIHVDCVKTFDLSLSNEKKRHLINKGEEGTRLFFE